MNISLVQKVVFWSACMACTASGSAPISDDRLCPGIVVRATVADFTVTGGRATATLTVAHVYCGPQAAQGATFIVSGPKNGQSTNGSPSMIPAYRNGESQIWMIARDGRDQDHWVVDFVTPHRMGRGLGYLNLPGRDRVPFTHYPDVKAWAEAVEETVRAPAGDRRKLLEDYSRSDVFQIREWARDVLGIRAPEAPTTRPTSQPTTR